MFYIIVERIFFFSPNKILIKRSHVYFVMFGGEGAINKFQSVCDWKNLEQILEGRIAGGKDFIFEEIFHTLEKFHFTNSSVI